MSWITIYLLIKDKEGHILEKLLSWTPIRFYFLMLIYRWQASRLKRWDYNFTNLMLITTSKEKEKRKVVVKSAVTLRALDTFFSTTGYPSLRADEIKLWLAPSAKQRRNPCSGLPAVYPDLSTRHDQSLVIVCTQAKVTQVNRLCCVTFEMCGSKRRIVSAYGCEGIWTKL